MQLDKFTIKAQEAVQSMQTLAKEKEHQEIDCEHLLTALLDQEDSLVQSVLQKLGVQVPVLEEAIHAILKQRARVTGGTDQYLSQALRKAFTKAESETKRLKDEYTSTEHLLLGIAQESSSALAKVFQREGVNRDKLLKALMELH